jgi:hypothetical protein
MIVGFIVASLVFVGPLTHWLLKNIPEPPTLPEDVLPEFYGPSRRLYELWTALPPK